MGGTPPPQPLSSAPAPSSPFPQDNEAFHNQTKGKSFKGENYVSTMVKGVGRGDGGGGALGRSCRHCRNRPMCIYSCLTQHNLIFHIKDQIIFQLQLITHPKSTSKGRSSSDQPGFAAPRAPRFHAQLLGVCGPGAPRLVPRWAFEAEPGGQGASSALRPLAGLPGWSHSQLMYCLPTKIVALVEVPH